MKNKKLWWPPPLYELKPRAALVIGLLCLVGAFVVSLRSGHWSAMTTFLVGVGAVLCIYGAVIMQMRREYRQRSKWSRKQGS